MTLFFLMNPLHHRPGSIAVFLLGIVAVFIAMGIALDGRRRFIRAQLPGAGQEELRDKNLAEQILDKVRRHIDLTDGTPATVATVIDAKKLREENPSFYAKVVNGDYLIVTPTRAILYSPTLDIILNVAPVQIQRRGGGEGNP